MPEFSYIATNSREETIRGVIEAGSLEEIPALLNASGLFMISSAPVSSFTPAAEAPAAAPIDLAQETARRRALRLKWEVVGVLVLAGYGWLSPPKTPGIPDTSVVAKVALIRPGMRRGDVENLLTRYGNGRSSERTRYVDFKQALIDVPYNGAGGEWSPENRVIGTPQVYTHFKPVGRHLEPE